ncbi:hypothetical protein VKT23_013502 [Stygiomarasmius scandens]|uniref:3'-5' exonuclease domain-containing protein n=1 Tax=Marasmiellus scandens TaxID=2682957 RepID=A0ABR1J602_9AGAR
MASYSANIVKGDHTFKMTNCFAQLKGQKLVSSVYTIANEWEEERAQVLAPTKSLAFLSEVFTDIEKGLEDHGHPPTQFFWTDNAKGELPFHESTTKALSKNVKHIEIDPYEHLPVLSLPENMPLTYHSASDLINGACEVILSHVPEDNNNHLVVGFDVEWQLDTTGQPGPGSVPHSRTGQVDVISISLESEVYVFKVSHFTNETSLPACLRAILKSPRIVKVGRAVKGDLLRICDAWQLSDLRKMLQDPNPMYVELGTLCKLKGKVNNASASLSALVGVTLGKCLRKDSSVKFSNWSTAQELSQIQQQYAGLDAYSSLLIWKTIAFTPSFGLKLTNDQRWQTGLPVSILNGKQVVALGSIAERPKQFLFKVDNNESGQNIKLTNARVVVNVTEVIYPGYIPRLHQQTLRDLQVNNTPLFVVVLGSQLRTRPAERAHNVTPLELDDPSLPTKSTISDIPVPLPDNLTMPDEADIRDDESDSDNESLSDPEAEEASNFASSEPNSVPESQISSTDISRERSQDVDMEEDDLYADPEIDRLIQQVDLTKVNIANPLLKQPAVEGESILSRVLEDIFHAEDRVLKHLPKPHSAYKPFARALKQVMLVPDKEDKEKVEKVLAKQGFTWEYALHSKPDEIRKRVRHYCPPPEKLVADLEILFDSWKNVKCCALNTKYGSLFASEASWKAAQALIQTAKLGLLSDPPGFSLYHSVGVDRDGLTIYRCLRGTNSLEGGVHMTVRRDFGSLRASPELGDSLLANIRHRRNISVGTFNRTGKRFRNHFDIWTRDEICDLALEISTDESYGITKFPKSLADKYNIQVVRSSKVEGIPFFQNAPVNILVHLSTATVDTYTFLKHRQQVLHAITPVHTPTEFKFFRELISTGKYHKNLSTPSPLPTQTAKSVNFITLTQDWNAEVVRRNGEQIFYKIPEQLEHHHKVWTESRNQKATLYMNENILSPAKKMLSAPDRYAFVLPATEVQSSQIESRDLETGSKGNKGKRPAQLYSVSGPSSASSSIGHIVDTNLANIQASEESTALNVQTALKRKHLAEAEEKEPQSEGSKHTIVKVLSHVQGQVGERDVYV